MAMRASLTSAQRAPMHAHDETVYPLLVALHRFIAAVDGCLVAMPAYDATACACIIARDARNAAHYAYEEVRDVCSVIGNANYAAHRSAGGAQFRFLSTLSACTPFSNPGSISHRTALILATVRCADARGGDTLTPAMGEPFLDYAGGVLRMEGVSLAELAEGLGTPFFLFGQSRLRANWQALERGLAAAGPGTVLRYCAKTNREAAVLETMAALGAHLLASHAAEAALAVRCGFPPERIAYARPVLTPEELDAALGLGVPLFHVHHPEDLAQLEAAAARAGRPVRVSFRLRGAAGFSLLGRLNRRLGLDADEIIEAARRAAASPWLEPAALNFYLGTQQSSLDGFARVFRGVLDLLKRLPTLHEVNLGGGIPSPTLRRVGPRQVLGRLRDRLASSSGNLETFAARLGARFRELVETSGLAEPPVLAAEPGRSIVGDAAVLVTRVCAVRGSWLFLDASRNHLPESPVLFARRILPLSTNRKGAERFWNLSGCTLNTLDVLDVRRRLPPLAPGDGLAFCDAGAYSISRASSYAGLSPAVYLLEADGTVRLVRKAEDVEDL